MQYDLEINRGVIERIKTLAKDGFGNFIPAYCALHARHPAIQSSKPYECADEAMRRGMPPTNIYLAGEESVVCWPSVTPDVGAQEWGPDKA